MLHVPILPAPTVKLDIQRLLQSSPSPPSLPTQSQPPSHSGTTHYPSFTPVSSFPAVSVSTQPLSAAARPQPSHQQALAPNYAPLHHRSHGAYSSSNPPSGNHPVPSRRDTSPDSGLSAASAAGSTISPGSSIIAPAKRPAPDEQHPSATPAKKQSKWTTAENATIISLRGQGMKWEDVSKRVPGRSPTSCRLHYQNYLERRTPWDDEKKNKLARLYERMKPDLWGPIAAELGVPWRSAEAMHWALGKDDMAHRAGVNPFSMSAPTSQTFTAAPSLHGHSPLSFGQVPGAGGDGCAPTSSYPQSSFSAGGVAGSTPLPSPGFSGPSEQIVDPTAGSGGLLPDQHPPFQQQQHYPFPNLGPAAAYRRPSDPGLGGFSVGRPVRPAPASAPGSVAGSVAGTETTHETLPAFGSVSGRPQTPTNSTHEQGRAGSLPSLAEVVSGVPAPAYAGFVGGAPVERRVDQPSDDSQKQVDDKAAERQQEQQRSPEQAKRTPTSNDHVGADETKRE